MKHKLIYCENLFNNLKIAIKNLFFSAEDSSLFYISPKYISFWYVKDKKGEIKGNEKSVKRLINFLDKSYKKAIKQPLIYNPKLYDEIRALYFSTITNLADIIEELNL